MSDERVKLFDEWADTYDRSVEDYQGFPFEGYAEVLSAVAASAEPSAGMLVLDIGIGTGRLAERFLRAECSVWGLDFSVKMLAKTHERFPQIELIKADLLGDWPIDKDRRFHRIVSGYVLHEFDLDSKTRLITRLVGQHLEPGGRMVVGDISFETCKSRDEARREWGGRWDEAKQEWERSLWDEEEHYWAADETVEALRPAGLDVAYRQISFCGGVYVISPGGAS